MNIFGLVIQTRKSQLEEFDVLVAAQVRAREDHVAQLISDAKGMASRVVDAEGAATKYCSDIIKLQNAIKGKDQVLRIAIKLLRENSSPDSQMGRLQRMIMGRVSGSELFPHELGHPIFDDATSEQREAYRRAQNHYSEIVGNSIETGVADSITGYKSAVVRVGDLG